MATKKKEYIPLDSSGNDYAGLAGMSELHRAAIEGAQTSYNQAKEAGDRDAMEAAHAQAEGIRALYGYSGGGDGSQYLPISQNKAEQTGGFSYGAAPSYASKYQDQIAALTQALLNREGFSYDHTQDENYLAYEDQYTRNGRRAMQDTLGQVAARTGGLASSYAGSAAQQTYNGYMAELAGIIPELRQAAYEMYQDEYQRDLNNISALQALEDSEYQRYLNRLGQYNTDRDFAYGAYQDQQAANQWQQSFDYSARQDALDREWAQEQLEYQKEQDALAADQWQQNFDHNAAQDALAARQWQQNFDYNTRQDTAEEDQEQERKPALTYSQVMDAIERGVTSDTVLQAYEYYMGEPYGTEQEEERGGVSEMRFGAIMDSLDAWGNGYLNGGNDGGLLVDTLAEVWDQLTQQQKDQITDELDRLGLGVNFE